MKRRLIVLKPDVVGESDILLTCRDPATQERIYVIVNGFEPHIYAEIEPDEVVAIDGVKRIVGGHVAVSGRSLSKIVLESPGVARFVRKQVRRPHEADIPFTQRFLCDTMALGTVDIDLDNELHPGVYAAPPSALHPVSWEVDARPHVLYFDIEVAATGSGTPEESARAAEDPLICVSVYDAAGDAWYAWLYEPLGRQVHIKELFERGRKKFSQVVVRAFRREAEMLSDFAAWICRRQPDVMAGWYSNTYDVPYIINRMRNVGVDPDTMCIMGHVNSEAPNIPGIQLVDMLEVHKMVEGGALESASLQYVAKDKAGIELDKDPGAISDWWREDPESLVGYNLMDVDATASIDRVTDYVGFAMRYMFMTRVDAVMDIASASIVLDVMALTESRGRFVQPMKPSEAERQASGTYEGAIVLDPVPGVHRNVAELDFWSMYPNIIIGANLSFETPSASGEIRLGNGSRFKGSPEGIFPAIARRLFEERERYEKLMKEQPERKEHWRSLRDPVKRLMVSLYGVTGFSGSRQYKKQVAEAVTYLGRELIKGVKSYLESRGYKVIYGDTDSVFVQMRTDDPISEAAQLREDVATFLQAHTQKLGMRPTERGRFLMEQKRFYDVFCIGSEKKRYFARKTHEDGQKLPEPKLHVRGFDWRRTETPEFSKEIQGKLFQMVIEGADADAIFDYVDGQYRKVVRGEVDAYLLAAKPSLKRKVYDKAYYAATAAKYSEAHLGARFLPGDRVRCVYVRAVPPGKPHTHLVGLNDDMRKLPDGYKVDWQQMADVAVRAKVETIFQAIGIPGKIGALGRQTLDAYFGTGPLRLPAPKEAVQ